MLSKARARIDAGVYKNSVKVIHHDISKQVEEISDNSVDYIISTYNPLSFVPEPQLAINEAYRILKPGGVAQITIQGYYNALYSKVNNYLANATELEDLFSEQKVQWNPSIPKLWQLPKASVDNLFHQAGFSQVESRGIATVTQPQGEDFDPENKQLGSLSKKLNDDIAFYNTLLRIELAAGRDQNAIDRAMNILTIGTK
jgi:ubiquinone/menaquinone biosynthesis C-methylase UbiE